MGDSIINTYFPHKTINQVFGEPSYASIFDVIQLIRTNASSVPTTLGERAHGLQALTMPGPDYFALTGHNFVAPAHPGAPHTFVQGDTGVI